MISQLPTELEALGVHQRFAVDVISVVRKVRRHGLLHVPIASDSGLGDVLSSIGLRIFAQRNLFRGEDPESREGILREPKIGEKPNFMEIWFALKQAKILPSADELFGNPGIALDYPPCCVNAWEKLCSQRDFYWRYLNETTPAYWELNRLATFFQQGLLIPDFYPCSLSCNAARDFASPIISLAREYLNPLWVSNTIRWMQAPILLRDEVLYAFPSWTLNNQVLEARTSDASRIRLADVGKFVPRRMVECRLIPFAHLSGATRMMMLGSDGIRSEVRFFSTQYDKKDIAET